MISESVVCGICGQNSNFSSIYYYLFELSSYLCPEFSLGLCRVYTFPSVFRVSTHAEPFCGQSSQIGGWGGITRRIKKKAFT